MHEKGLPVLPHQVTAMREAAVALDAQRPGATQDLLAAYKHERGVRDAVTQLKGPERVSALLSGLAHEEKVRRDPELRAERLVKQWKGLEAQRDATKGWQHAEEHTKIKGQMKDLAFELKRDAQLESVVRERSRQLGIARGSQLDEIMKSRTPQQGMEIAMNWGRGHGLSR